MNPFRYSNPNKIPIPVQTWLKNDDKKQWQHNRKQLGEGWYYYNADDIEYKHNSYGYRCPEFDSSNGKIKFRLWGVVMCTEKVITSKDTISSLYSNCSGIPTINMGVCGSVRHDPT